MHTQRNTHTHTRTRARTHARVRAYTHTHTNREKKTEAERQRKVGEERQTDRDRETEREMIYSFSPLPVMKGYRWMRETNRGRERFFPKSFAGQENTSPTPSPRRKRPQSHCLKARLTPRWETLQCQERFTYILVKERSHRTSE